MTDLTAACARHGIITAHDNDGWHAGCTPGGNIYEIQQGLATEAHAVCALLKARWGMTTRVAGPYLAPEWEACEPTPPSPSSFLCVRGSTEIAAVVALADRLAGVVS